MVVGVVVAVQLMWTLDMSMFGGLSWSNVYVALDLGLHSTDTSTQADAPILPSYGR